MFNTRLGTPCFHEKEAIGEIRKVIRAIEPEVIIELGTKHGGFTKYLQDFTDSDVSIYSFDHIEYESKEGFTPRVEFFVADLLSATLQEVVSLCSSNKRKLLYCDNGNKIQEVKAYAVHLKEGDVLGIHDWGTEISYSSVEDVLCKFKPFMNEDFEKNGWKTRFWKRGPNDKNTDSLHNVQ